GGVSAGLQSPAVLRSGARRMRTWLAKLAVNACRTHRRRNLLRNLMYRVLDAEESESDPIDLSVWGAPEDHALRTELRRTVKDVLAKLRPEHRAILVLYYYMDFSCLEIARILDCPEGTVHSRLHYARCTVQDQLERYALRSNSEVKR